MRLPFEVLLVLGKVVALLVLNASDECTNHSFQFAFGYMAGKKHISNTATGVSYLMKCHTPIGAADVEVAHGTAPPRLVACPRLQWLVGQAVKTPR